MSDIVIRAENLGKKYQIQHQQERQRYVALRDVFTEKLLSPWRWISKHRTNPQSTIRNPQSEDFWALKDVSFEIKQGEVVGIIGRNGAGGQVKVEKTELSREPIRADSVIFSRGANEKLHTEFQTTLKSEVPVPLRMLDYYVGLKRQNPNQRVRQVLVVLKATGEVIPDRYEDEWTVHRYMVVKLWEQDPAELLKHAGLLPLATLCRAESGEQLLGAVAAQIKRIKLPEQRREAVNASRVFAGLRYDRGLINRILKESDMLEESVIYQDIFQKGAQQGLQHERHLVLRMLERLLGKLPVKVRKQVEQLDFEQLATLGEALFDFTTEKELVAWLKRHAVSR